MRSSNPMRAWLEPVEDRASLVFACIESHGCMKVWGPLAHVCVLSWLSHGPLPLSSLPSCSYSPLSIMAVKLSTGLMTSYRPVGNHEHIHVLHATLYHRWLGDLYIMTPLTKAVQYLYICWPSPYCSVASYVTPAFIMDAILTAASEGGREGGGKDGVEG